MNKGNYTIEELKDIIISIAKKYQLSRVYLFWSFARGDYDDNSDIDIRIEKGMLTGMFALCGFYAELEAALNRKIDLFTTKNLDAEFLECIRKDEVVLYAICGNKQDEGV